MILHCLNKQGQATVIDTDIVLNRESNYCRLSKTDWNGKPISDSRFDAVQSDLVETSEPAEKTLAEAYQEKFDKPVPNRYKNNNDWIQSQLA